MKTELDSTIATLLDETLDLLQTSVKAAGELETENATLRQKLAKKEGEERVVLEKVASLEKKPTFSEGHVTRLVQALGDQLHMPASEREKIASNLKQDPNFALVLSHRLLDLSTPASSEGVGVAKTASENLSDPDGWGNCK